MKRSTAVVLGACALVAVFVAWMLATVDRGTDPAPATDHPAVTQAAPPSGAPPRAARVVPSSSVFGIDGTTQIGSDAAPAMVAACAFGVAVEPGAAGSPVLGRLLFDVPEPAPPAARTASDATGVFTLDGLGPGTWLVVATFDAGRRAAAKVDLTPDAPRARVVLAAPAGGSTLRGRAIRGDGSPFVGWIGLRQIGQVRSADVWILSDAAGAFAFAGVPPGEASLSALRSGESSASVLLRIPHGDEVLLVVDARGATRRGRVVAAKDGTAIPGATVVSEVRSGRGFVDTRTTAGPDGRFEFASPGQALLEVHAEGFVLTRVEDDGSGDEVLVRLEERAVVTGRVVRADDGSPVAGAVVHSVRAVPNAAGESQTTSDPEGVFRLEACAVGRVAAYVLGGGWASEGMADAQVGGANAFTRWIVAGSTSELVLRVVPTARVEGRVVDAAGDPVPWMRVEARRPIDVRGWPLGGAYPTTVTAPDGAFTFIDLVPGAEWTFWTRPASGETKSTDPQRLAAGSTTKVEIRLDPLRRIAVTVLAAGTDVPVADAVVSVATASHGPWDRWQGASSWWTTDANGTADVGPVGTTCVGVHARAPGYVEGRVTPETVDETTLRAVVRLARAKPIAGRVVVPAGVPFEIFRVGAENRAQTRFFTEIDADGAFRFDTLAEEPWTLYVTADWGGHRYEAKCQAHPGDVTILLKVDEPTRRPSIRVRVWDAQGGPVADGRVAYSFSYGSVTSGGSVPIRGGVAWVALPTGPSRGVLAVRAKPGGAVASGAVRVDLPEPLPREFDVRLPPELRISGRVISPSGAGVAGVRVVARPADGAFAVLGTQDEDRDVPVTDQDGAFDVGGLGAFTYRLQCSPPPGLAQRRPVVAVAGATGVEVRLSLGADAAISVTGPDGLPVGECVAEVTYDRESAGSTRTSPAGIGRFSGLDPELAYTLRIDPPPSRDDLSGATFERWTPRDTSVRLERAQSIAGIVRDAEGRPIEWATVLHSRSGRGWTQTTAGADGRFRVGSVRAGAIVRLRARRTGEQDMAYAALNPPDIVEVTAGATDVVLVVDTRDVAVFRIEGAPEGVATSWVVSTTKSPASGSTRRRAGSVTGDGVLSLRGLEPAMRHRLIVGPTGDGRFALSGDIVPGTPEVPLRLVAGEALSGRVVLTEGVGAKDLLVRANGDLWEAHTTADAQGRFRFPGLPPEACQVGVVALRDGKIAFTGHADTRPGADVTIELAPFRDGGGR